jgi:ion channel-forming bestrophin family protein
MLTFVSKSNRMLLNTTIPAGFILSKVKTELLLTLVITASVYLITHLFADWFPEMPLTIPAFIGTAISILLSFKLNQSYERWWEARKIWGSIVNDSRSFIIQLQSLLPSNQTELVAKMANRQIAWCYTLAAQLRGLDPLSRSNEFISKDELTGLERHTNKALALLQMHANDLAALRRENKIDQFIQIQLDNTLTRLCDAMGRAERIKSTVFPVTYSRFLHFTIYLFVVTLAVSLGNVQWYFEIPLLALISSAFFLLEKSATHMQDPFSNKPTDTAMNAISRTIEINLRQIVADREVPAPYPAESFYLM